MKNPVKASELGKQDYMRCEQPVIAKEICNGLDDDNNQNVDEGLLNRYPQKKSQYETRNSDHSFL